MPALKSTVPASLFLFAFWLILTASFHPVDLAIGFLLSVVLGVWSVRTFWSQGAPTLSPTRIVRLCLYLLTLTRTIVVAAAHVARIVLDPRLPVAPVTISHRLSLDREVSRIAFANSLTLTPGTLTVELEGDTIHVHCLAARFGTPVTSGELERRVAQVFEDGARP